MAGSRELQYRVVISTSDAQRQARNVRSSIERELRQITVGQLDTRQMQNAVTEAQRLRLEFDNIARSAAQAQQTINNIDVPAGNQRLAGSGNAAAAGFLGGIAGYLTLNLAQTVSNVAQEFVAGNTEIKRANVAFVELAGSVQEAQGRLVAIQEGAAGAVSQLEAIKIANQAASLGLAQTADEFQRLTEAARVTALISPVINDVSSAITELGLASANLSYRRLDQLGLSVTEVRDRMRELQQANADMTDSQAFLEASVDSLIRKGEGLLNSQAAQASGLERFNVAINEFLDQEGAFSNAIEDVFGGLADVINEIFTVTNFGSDKTIFDFLETEVARIKAQLRNEQQSDFIPFSIEEDGLRQSLSAYTQLRNSFAAANDDIRNGVPGALDYRAALREITVAAEQGALRVDEIADAIAEANRQYKEFQTTANTAASFDQAIVTRASADKAEQDRRDELAASILESQQKIDEALAKQATDSAAVIGVENAIRTLNEQKTLVDAAIQELIDSAITDPAELEIRLAQIRDQALGFFDEVEAAAQTVTIDFSGAGDLLSGFDQSFVDFLPGLSDLRDQFAELQIELAYTTDITAEQAAEFEYLSAAAAVASGDAVFLDDVVNQLGVNFLATNETAALLVDQLYLAAAAYASGAITAEQYAGVTAALGSQLLALASEAGVATSAIHELIAAQGGLAGTSGFAVGQQQGAAIGQGIQARQAAVQRDRARREAERAADRARREAESAAKRAAREQESAAKRAARELEQGAKKAAQELQGALRNVPGLFSPTQVTEGDFKLAEAGIYSDQADEYLRRLRDEVLNGTDWADVSIDEAKQALRDLGYRVADDNRIALQQFEEAWSNQVLFSDAANIDKFIDEEAVQRSLDLQEKAKQGQENIFKHFGAVVDDAVEAVVSGVSSGGGVSGSAATGYTIPVSAQLIPASADLTSIPTLGGESFVLDVASIQGQLDTLVLPELTIDTTALDALTGTVTVTPELASDAQTVISAAVDALTAPKIPIGAKVDYSSLADALSFMGSQKVTILLRTGIYEQGFADTLETIGSTKQSIQITGVISSYGVAVEALGQLDTAGKAAADRLKQAIADNVGATPWDEGGIVAPIADGLISAINTQVRGRTAGIQREGGNVGEILKSGIASSVSATAWEDGQIVAPIAQGLITAINTQVRGMTEGFQREGGNIAAIVMSGLANSWQQQDSGGNAGTGLAFGLLTELNRQLDATQNFFYAAGQTPAGNMIDGFSGAFTTKNADGSTRSTLVSGMLDSITQGIRINAENFQQRGVTVANYMQAGFTSQFGNETFKTNLVAAGELMAGYLKQGILQNLNGVADEIAAKVMDDISTGLEAPQ